MTPEEIVAAARQSMLDDPPPPASEALRLLVQTIMQPAGTGLAA